MNTNPSFNHKKYRPHRPFAKPDRKWPSQTMTAAPDWCSVDLRDGNQALIEPMTPSQKLRMFELLVDVGFKEIEVGFPAASAPDFDFIRQLIREGRVPDDVTIQVLTPARPALIVRTFEALRGARRAIVHLYNSTSTVQREEVFGMSEVEVRNLAVEGATCIRDEAEKQPETEWFFQYSPESFTGTEMEYALSVCNAVIDVWQPRPSRPVIINLPATVEVSTPNVYADQIEWMSERLNHRQYVRLSLHTHNDRGCGVAAAELGVLAGANRVEGTLLGNGERTGNMCVVTMAMNFYSQGIDPRLDLSNMDRIKTTVEACTQLKVHPRHPYAGDLVYSAFSGSHQDAINKCLKADRARRALDPEAPWQVAYLPIDPRDLGRSYDEVVRVNSQSGKGGVAFVLEQQYQLSLPRWLQVDFSPHVQHLTERAGSEASPAALKELFESTYLHVEEAPVIEQYSLARKDGLDSLEAHFRGRDETIRGEGSGVLEAFVRALSRATGLEIILVHYDEHSLGADQGSEAVAYVQVSCRTRQGTPTRACAVGRSRDIIEASMQAVANATTRATKLLNSH
jgi:2-isopropylmalate synthase